MMKPVDFQPIKQKDKSYSHLTTRQYIVTQLATSQMSIRSDLSDENIDAVIKVLERVADRILKD